MGGFRLGSVFGFEIRIDYSWFIVFFLILWSFTVGVFPLQYPGLPAAVYAAMGVAGTLLFFASVLAHELSHSLVARTKGIPVEGITLFIFGGVARTRMEFEDPGDELQVAGVGPLSSLVIAGVFGAVGWLGAAAGWSVAVTGVARYLAFLNLILALFNLLPGFPLDGGRLFRALVWKYTGDLTRATRVASNVGKGIGYLLMGLGVLQLFAGNLLGGMWIVFIGWFMRGAAEMGYTQQVLRDTLQGVRAREAMTPHPATVPPEMTLRELVEDHFLRGRHNAYPVLEGERPVGIVTLQQVKEVPREEWPHRTVRETMAAVDEDRVVRPEEDMTRVLERMEGSDARRVLVVRDGRLEGIITPRDVAGWLERARMLGG